MHVAALPAVQAGRGAALLGTRSRDSHCEAAAWRGASSVPGVGAACIRLDLVVGNAAADVASGGGVLEVSARVCVDRNGKEAGLQAGRQAAQAAQARESRGQGQRCSAGTPAHGRRSLAPVPAAAGWLAWLAGRLAWLAGWLAGWSAHVGIGALENERQVGGPLVRHGPVGRIGVGECHISRCGRTLHPPAGAAGPGYGGGVGGGVSSGGERERQQRLCLSGKGSAGPRAIKAPCRPTLASVI